MTKVQRAEPAAARGISTIGFHLTDTGNAERLVARHRDLVRYCPPRRRWLIWDGKRWAWDRRGEIEQLAKRTVRAIYAEAEHARDQEHLEAVVRHATNSEKRDRRAAMIALAQSELGIPVLPDELDSDPLAFNVGNGTIDLSSGELREHRRADLITKLTPVDYVTGARHALWDLFLDEATGGDHELARYLQCVAGYALYGRVTEKAFWFLYGPPDGMKSTFMDALSCALGEYAVFADFGTWLVQTQTGGNRGDLVALMGARLVCSSEVRKGAKFDEAVMKRVTGGDMIKAAAKYEAEIEFLPTFTLVLAANDAPLARDDDEGFWSRSRRVPFTNPVDRAKRDPRMRDKLRAPDVQSAILAWAIEGCLRWQAEGFGSCAAVERSTAEYREEMDRVAGFFADRCAFGAEDMAKARDLRDAYEDWCKENGVRHALNGKDLAARLRGRGCTPAKVDKDRGWKGVRVLRAWEYSERHEGQQGLQSPGNPSREENGQGSWEQTSLGVPGVLGRGQQGPGR